MIPTRQIQQIEDVLTDAQSKIFQDGIFILQYFEEFKKAVLDSRVYIPRELYQRYVKISALYESFIHPRIHD